jgi:hypothetical protein
MVLTTAADHEQPEFCRYLEHEATLPEIALFIAAEELVDGKFDDLVAMVQVGLTGPAKMTIAENYWDEMGRGDPGQVHTTLFASSSAYMIDLLASHGVGVDGLESAEIYENACLLMYYGIHRPLVLRALGAMGVLEQSASPRFEAMVAGARGPAPRIMSSNTSASTSTSMRTMGKSGSKTYCCRSPEPRREPSARSASECGPASTWPTTTTAPSGRRCGGYAVSLRRLGERAAKRRPDGTSCPGAGHPP